MNPINFFKYIGEKRPEYKWEDVKKKLRDDGIELPLEGHGDFVDGKKNGIFVEYGTDWDGTDEDEKLIYLRKKHTYKNGWETGPYALYHPNGHPKVVGNYKNGNEDGLMTYYNANRDKTSTINFKDGRKDGKQTTYYPNGNIKSETNYVGGRKRGEEISYDEDGNINARISYNKDGLKDGPFEIYKNGKLYIKGEYRNDSPIGKQIIYDEDGNEIK